MTGREQGFEEREEITMLWLIGTKRYKGRSLYENSETMVEPLQQSIKTLLKKQF